MGIIQESEVLHKLDALKSYSVAVDPATESLFEPIYEAVDAYFNGDDAQMVTALEDVVKYMYNDISRRTTVYENEFPIGLPKSFPIGYEDVTECFYGFTQLLTITESSFFDGFIYGLPEGDAGDGMAAEVPLSNSYFEQWTKEITAAVTGDLQNVTNLAEWCKNSGGCCDLICLLENRGRALTQMTVKEKAKMIYVDRKMLEVIEQRNLNVYVPTYLKG